jgi:O-antigen ligase
VTIALLWIIKVGFEQHFGGLEATRKFFYSLPDWQKAPPEFIKKLSSNRIYSTLFYPNTLAGALLLVLPITLGFVWTSTVKFQTPARWLILALLIAPSLACFYWSQSKAGWLIALALAALSLMNSKLPIRIKIPVLIAVIGIGAAAFLIRHAQYFERGATSVVARTDYWKAAVSTGLQHPIFGTGPGTFSVAYAKIKSPDAEMARLTHNDFLQQLSDSGIVGFTTFSALISAVLVLLYRYRNKTCWFVALGLSGLIFHQVVEFHLYIPALAWPFFFLVGWILRTSIPQAEAQANL